MIGLDLRPELLLTFVLCLTRTTAWLTIAPPFNSSAITPRVRAALGVAISLAIAPQIEVDPSLLELGPMLSAIALQVFVGLSLGFVVNLLFAALQGAGAMVDLSVGFSAAQLYDPFTNAATSPLGRFYQLLAITLLFAINGHLLLVGGFLRSFRAAPLEVPSPGAIGSVLTDGIGTFLLAAIEIALPLLAVLIATEFVLALMSKAAPQLNVLALGFAAKSGVLLIVAGVSLPVLPAAVNELVTKAVTQSTALLGG